jgi:hypothetical protein
MNDDPVTTAADTALAHIERPEFMPVMSIERAIDRYNTVTEFVSRVLRKDVDYGVIPGTDKPTLLKPGAEKLITFFGLSTRFHLIERIEDWEGADHGGEPFFYYLYRCQLSRDQLLIAEADGSCNSRESKYRYRASERLCPACAQAAVIKGKEEYGGGWLCLLPETPILYADFVWRPIGQAKPGDVVLGFDEYPAGGNVPRRFRPAVIEDVWWSRQQTQRLITTDADIVTTARHRWLRHQPAHAHWSATERLQPGVSLRSIGVHATPPITDDYRAGYLAGITREDGAAHFILQEETAASKPFGWRVALKESGEAALGRIVAYLAALGIEAHVRPLDSGAARCPMKEVEVRSATRFEAIRAALSARETLEFQRGFLAGFFDAECSSHEGRQRFDQKDWAALRLIRQYAANLGFTFDVRARADGRSSAQLRGRTLDRLRFFSAVQPALWHQSGLYGATMWHKESPVLRIERGLMRDVVDIQTSTGTFFAAGLATHNCFKKKGGCGARFAAGDPAIESQPVGRILNPDIADSVNTIQKMAQKRSLISACLLAVNASEFFTQDLEDMMISTTGAGTQQDPTETADRGDGAGQLRAEIFAVCRALGKTEAQLTEWVKKKYRVDGMGDLTPAQQREVLLFLKSRVK